MFFNGYNGPKENMHEKFGKTEKEVQRYITKIDPITKGPVTFLGKPLAGGINLMMLPFLKIAEEEIEKSGVNYVPDGKAIGGFDFRDMKVQGKPSGYPSFHKFGLAIDIDAFQNMPRHDRGTIPDQVVMAMVKNGFASGLVAHPDFTYLSADPMHFQLRFPPESEQGQEIINASAVGIQYWEAVKPLLEAIA